MSKLYKVLFFKRYNGFKDLFKEHRNDDLLDGDVDDALTFHFAGKLLMPRDYAKVLCSFLKERRMIDPPLENTLPVPDGKRVCLLQRNCVFLCGHPEVLTELEQDVVWGVANINTALRGPQTVNRVKYEFMLEIGEKGSQNYSPGDPDSETYPYTISGVRFYGQPI